MLDKDGKIKIKNKELRKYLKEYEKKHGYYIGDYRFAIDIWNLAVDCYNGWDGLGKPIVKEETHK